MSVCHIWICLLINGCQWYQIHSHHHWVTDNNWQMKCQREYITLPGWGSQNETGMWWWGWSSLEDGFPSPHASSLQSTALSSQLYSLEFTQASKAWPMWSGISRVQQAGCQKNLLNSCFNMNFLSWGNKMKQPYKRELLAWNIYGEK